MGYLKKYLKIEQKQLTKEARPVAAAGRAAIRLLIITTIANHTTDNDSNDTSNRMINNDMYDNINDHKNKIRLYVIR